MVDRLVSSDIQSGFSRLFDAKGLTTESCPEVLQYVLSLVPLGLMVSQIRPCSDQISVFAQSRSYLAACPLCQQVSHHLHSHSIRRLTDLPWANGRVRRVRKPATVR